MAKVLNEERFNPSRLPGLSLWLDAQATTTISSTTAGVSSWSDRSGVGNTFTSTTSSGGSPTLVFTSRSIGGFDGNWVSVASDASRTKLATATFNNGYIVTSSDSGNNWTYRDSGLPSGNNWTSVASSSDGTKLALVANNDRAVYTSSNSGQTWVKRSSANGLPNTNPNISWKSVASSSDGLTLVVVDSGINGLIYISLDSGQSWANRTPDFTFGESVSWSSIASDATGTKLVVVDSNLGYILTYDSGRRGWDLQFNGLPSSGASWSSIASSSDATKLTVVDTNNGWVYTSLDSGQTWIQRTNGLPEVATWTSIASDATGAKLVIVENNSSYVYTSSDSGQSWVQQTNGLPSAGVLWSSVASSSDGTKLVIVSTNGFIYTGVFATAPSITVPPPVISNTLITNQPSIFFPPGAQMISTSNSDLGTLTISGCILWLDAADRTTYTYQSGSTTNIGSWRDKSSNGYVFTQNPVTPGAITTSTQNEKTALNFGTNVMTIPNFTWYTQFTTLFVVNTNNWFYAGGAGTSTNFYTGYILSGNWYLIFTPGAGPTYDPSYGTPGKTPVSSVIPNQWCIFSIGYGGETQAANYAVNGTSRSTNPGLIPTGQSATSTPLYLNGRWDYGGGNTQIGEIIHFNRSITSQERQTVEGYLATKWGLRANLPTSHPYYLVPYPTTSFTLNPFTPVSKSIFMTYQTPALTSTMRFAVGDDVSGGAFGFSQTQYYISSPYQYGAGYGDTRWKTNIDQYTLPTVLSAIYDASAGIIRGDRNFNADADVRESAMINIISNTPYSLGRSPITSSIVTSASFHVCEIIAYNRALATTDRQMIEGYMAWKWGIVGQLPNGHPYKEFPPSGEQVIIPSTPLNLMQGLVSWLDMADTSSYTLSGTTLKTLTDKAGGTLFTISGKPNGFSFSTIGSLPALVFPGNNTSTLLANTFLFRSVPVPSQGSACMVLVPKSQFTASKLGILGWGGPGNSAGNPALGYNAPTTTVETLQSYNTATNTFFGPSLNLAANTPTILFWAWYGGNMSYLSCNGTTLLTSTPGTTAYYNSASTDSQFYIGNDGGFGAQFTLGELCMYSQYGETPFRNLLEGHLAWKWGLQSNLPAYHPYYYSAPGLQSLTEVNALSQPSDIAGLTMWLDAADTTTVQQVNSAVTLTGSPTLLGVSNGYTYYAFRGNGTITSANPVEIQYFAIGGGGGGGFDYGAGGGAGGLQTNTAVSAYPSQVSKIRALVPGAVYTVTIGTGGAYQVGTNPYRGGSGGNTTFIGSGVSVTANGGGGGGGGGVGTGGDGGSGGGGGYPFPTTPGGTGTQGGNGITGVMSYWGGAGGGIGGNATSGGPTPLNGGPGLQFFGTFYGGGGGGAAFSGTAVGSGGSGVGGTGAYGNFNLTTGVVQAIPPVANSGGGGAGGSSGSAPGTAGAAGIFIVGIPLTQIVWTDKSAVANHVFSTTPGNAPTPSNFGTARRPSVYFGPGKSAASTYNSGASTGQFSAFVVASIPTLSYLLISSGQFTTATSAAGANGQTFAFYGSNGSTFGVCSPYVSPGGTKVGPYSTICGATVELFASVSGLTTLGNLNFGSTVSGTCATIQTTPWVFGDCLGDSQPKSFHVHEFITYSRQLTTNERWIIEGYLYWKWMQLI